MGLHVIPDNTKIDFIGIRKIAYAVSILLIVAGILSLVVKGGPKYGIDFAGGVNAHIKFEEPIPDEVLKNSLAGSGLPGLVIQSYGTDNTDYLLRISAMDETSESISATVKAALNEHLGGKKYDIPLLENVGPKVGADLRGKAVEALFFSILIVAVYISGRFENRWFSAAIMAAVLGVAMYGLSAFGVSKIYLTPLALIITLIFCWRLKLVFAMGTIVSMVHDLLITVGIFSLLDKEFDLTIIAALLTVVGYSLNDTIVVYDRIRENLRSDHVSPLSDVINRSINQTLSRTILTSGTTLLVIASLMFFGGDIIHDFALVMFIGVAVGTASSIFVASPILLAFGDSIDREPPSKEKKKLDSDGRLAPQV